MWLDQQFRPQLRQAGLDGFDEVMGTHKGRCLRELRIRENWYLPAAEARQKYRGLYLKKHHIRTWTSRLRAWLGIGPGHTAARAEVQNCRCLTANGIEVMRVVAYGEKLHANGLLESFLLTEELHGYTELRHFLRQRFPPPPDHITARDRELDRLICQVAQLARRFHDAGYNHRDFYCCHVLVKEQPRGQFDVRVIDLQRMQRRRWFRLRWLVKDLAQLAWSLPRDRIRCTHKLAFMRHYLGVKKLRSSHKWLIRLVLLKQRLMEWKLGIEP